MPMSRRAKQKGKKGKSPADGMTRRRELFLETAREFTERNRPLVLKDIAAACGIDKSRPSKWMRLPEFRAAFAQVIRDAHPPLVEAAFTSLLQHAIRGNLGAFASVMDRMERHGRFGAALASGGDSADDSNAPGVHIHVHGIPERQPFESLPPPAQTLPANKD